MKTFAFRTEGFDDGKRVPALLAKLGVSKYVNEEICDPGNENWKMDKFIVEVEDSVELETFRTRMAELVDVNKEFENMHRCHETLAEGRFLGSSGIVTITIRLVMIYFLRKMKLHRSP